MILNRLKKHFREQNWFAVIIEIFIVILGVTFAFQINVWNENRKDRVLENKLLLELRSDLEETRLDLKSDMLTVNFTSHVLDSLLKSLYMPELYHGDLPYEVPGKILFYRGSLYPKISAYKSIQSFGISSIRNDSLRARISDFYELSLTRIQVMEENYHEIRNNRLIPVFKAHFKGTFDEDSDKSPDEILQDIPFFFEALVAESVGPDFEWELRRCMAILAAQQRLYESAENDIVELIELIDTLQ